MTTMILQAYYIIAYLKNSRPPKYSFRRPRSQPRLSTNLANGFSYQYIYSNTGQQFTTLLRPEETLTIYIRFPRYLIATNPISNTEYQKD